MPRRETQHAAFARFLLAMVVLLVAAPAPAAIEPEEQAKTFARVFRFDRQLSGQEISLLLVHSGNRAQAADLEPLAAAFRGAGMTTQTVAVAELEPRLSDAQVVYLLPETASAPTLDAIRAAGVLSIAATPELAEQGRVGIALGDAGGKTEIIVNLDRVQEEGHELSSQLFKLARVVRESAASPSASSSSSPSEELQPPVLVTIDGAAYPAMARRLRVQGAVVMRLLVGGDGKVLDIVLEQGIAQSTATRAPASVYEEMNEAALAAARSARFRPATQGGTAVEAWFRITVPFRL